MEAGELAKTMQMTLVSSCLYSANSGALMILFQSQLTAVKDGALKRQQISERRQTQHLRYCAAAAGSAFAVRTPQPAEHFVFA